VFRPLAAWQLKSGWALPGWGLLALWSLLGSWSRIEFIFRKLDWVAQSGWAQLALLVAGLVWLPAVVSREPSEADRRLERVKKLLREAKAHFDASPRMSEVKDIHGATEEAFRDVRLNGFLERAFRHDIAKDHWAFAESEREKWKDSGSKYEPHVATAEYIERLIKRIGPDDLDYGFHLPESYEQYRKTDGWVPNMRPEPKP
jgi:hypothetical protein